MQQSADNYEEDRKRSKQRRQKAEDSYEEEIKIKKTEGSRQLRRRDQNKEDRRQQTATKTR